MINTLKQKQNKGKYKKIYRVIEQETKAKSNWIKFSERWTPVMMSELTLKQSTRGDDIA